MGNIIGSTVVDLKGADETIIYKIADILDSQGYYTWSNHGAIKPNIKSAFSCCIRIDPNSKMVFLPVAVTIRTMKFLVQELSTLAAHLFYATMKPLKVIRI